MTTPELCLGPKPDDRLALVLKHAGTHLSQAQAPQPLGCFEDVSCISQVPRHYCEVISLITVSIKTCLAGLEAHPDQTLLSKDVSFCLCLAFLQSL